MTWLLVDVLVYVGLAALFGGAVGWWLRSGHERRRLAELEHERRNLETGYERAERGRIDAEARLAERESAWAAERNALDDEATTAKEDAARAKAAAAASDAHTRAETRATAAEKAAAERADRIVALEAERVQLQAVISKTDDRRREAELRLRDAEGALRASEVKLKAAEQASAAALAALGAQEGDVRAPETASPPAEAEALRRRLAEVERALERTRAEARAAEAARLSAEAQLRVAEAVPRETGEVAALRRALAAATEERDRAREREDRAIQALLVGERLLMAAEEKLQRIAMAERAAASLGERLREAERERDAAAARAAAAEARLHDADALVRIGAALSSDLAAARQRIAALEASRHVAAPRPADEPPPPSLRPAPGANLPPPAAADADLWTAAARRAAGSADLAGAQPPRLATPAGRADDLRRIRGIGPFNEETLHALGIFHFSQIATLSEANIAWLDDYLGFKGRIEREDWVGQARRLMASKNRGTAD